MSEPVKNPKLSRQQYASILRGIAAGDTASWQNFFPYYQEKFLAEIQDAEKAKWWNYFLVAGREAELSQSVQELLLLGKQYLAVALAEGYQSYTTELLTPLAEPRQGWLKSRYHAEVIELFFQWLAADPDLQQKAVQQLVQFFGEELLRTGKKKQFERLLTQLQTVPPCLACLECLDNWLVVSVHSSVEPDFLLLLQYLEKLAQNLPIEEIDKYLPQWIDLLGFVTLNPNNKLGVPFVKCILNILLGSENISFFRQGIRRLGQVLVMLLLRYHLQDAACYLLPVAQKCRHLEERINEQTILQDAFAYEVQKSLRYELRLLLYMEARHTLIDAPQEVADGFWKYWVATEHIPVAQKEKYRQFCGSLLK